MDSDLEGDTVAPLIEEQRSIPSKSSLYVSHFLSTWNSRGFEFGAVLFLAAIFPGTLLPLSGYALTRAAAAIVFSPYVGRVIDSQERLHVMRISIIGQRLSVVASCLAFLVLLHGVGQLMTYLMFSCLVLLACVEKLCSVMNTVAVERDWVVVIAAGQEEILQEMNSQMRRIDLFCKLLSPLAIALLDGVSSKVAVMFTLTINAGVVGGEYFLIARVYHKTPALAQREPASELVSTPSEGTATTPIVLDKHITTLSALSSYVQSSAFLPSMSLAVLYLTVLSFGGQMSTFLLSIPHPKLTSTTVGLLRTASTVFELSSTFIAPRLMTYLGPIRAGIWCLSWQLLCLTCGIGLLWASATVDINPTINIIILISSVILSRAGLWSFDLIAQFHVQNAIEPSQRGSFSSVEASLQNFFELCTFATTIIWARPKQFKYPALISLVATYAAAALYAKFVRDRRGHLLHLPQCLKVEREARYDVLSPRQDRHSIELDHC